LKNTFQIKAFSLARELGEQLYLKPSSLDSKNGIQYDNHLNLTVFTIYDDRLDKVNQSYVEVALGDYAINKEYGIAQDTVLEWFQDFILRNAQEAKPKAPEFWQRVALRTEKEVSAFCSSLIAFLENPPTAIEVQKPEPKQIPSLIPDERVVREIWARRGQAEFRGELLAAYNGKCAITGCAETEVLEAAHIVPYREEQAYSINNGLLLRADVHILFDLFCISINPNTGNVVVSQKLSQDYQVYNDKPVRLPSDQKNYPDGAAISMHYQTEVV
jgi:hypothetical protein